MALTTIPLPYGVRDIKITPYSDAAGTQIGSSSIDLPYSQTLSFTDSTDSDELRGDDVVVTSHDKGTTVNWELEAGGISLEAFKAISGGVLTTASTTPNQVKTYRKDATTSRPYFRIEGQVISDSGGDFHVVIPRCKATGNLSGDFKDGSFFTTGLKGDGYASLVAGPELGAAYYFVQNETATAIASTPAAMTL